MSLPQSTTNAAGLVVGAAASTNPFWLDPSWMTGTYQFIMAAGGFIVLVFTLWNVIETRIEKERAKRKPRNGEK